MKRLLFALTLLLATLATEEAPAQLTPISECHPAAVFFGNGVWNDQDKALASSEILDTRLRSRLEQSGSPEGRGLVVSYSLNPTDSYHDDLVQAMAQLGISLSARELQESLTNSALTADQQAVLALAYNRLLLRAIAVDSGAVAKHATTYVDYIRRGYRVVVVAHSQGNLHANHAARFFLTSNDVRRHFSILAAATPDSVVEVTRRPHVTIFGDEVWSIFPGSPLPKNTDSPVGDWTGHGFTATYLKASSLAESLILGGTLGTIRELPPPPIPTSVAVTANPAAVIVNQSVTLTATVTPNCPLATTTPPVPTGTVDFKENGTTKCSATVGGDGKASCSTSFSPAGTYTVTAEYSGDTQRGFAPSIGTASIAATDRPVVVVALAGAGCTVEGICGRTYDVLLQCATYPCLLAAYETKSFLYFNGTPYLEGDWTRRLVGGLVRSTGVGIHCSTITYPQGDFREEGFFIRLVDSDGTFFGLSRCPP